MVILVVVRKEAVWGHKKLYSQYPLYELGPQNLSSRFALSLFSVDFPFGVMNMMYFYPIAKGIK